MNEPGGILEPFGRWGLLPDRPDGARSVLRHWFVHFNPLYLLSALCVLGGVFLVNRSLDRLPADGFDGPRLALFAVIQAYELLVVAGAAFLVRRARVVRPAVLLVLLEAVFLFDVTLRLESLLLRSPLRFGVTLVWLGFVPLKVWGMASALRIRLSRALYLQVVASAAALASVVHLLAHPATDKLLVLQLAAWAGALVIGLLDVTAEPPRSPLATTNDERWRADRCSRGAFRIAAGAYFVHLWAYILVDSSFRLACAAAVAQLGTLFLRLALTRSRDVEIWSCGVALACVALPNPSAVPWALLVAASAFAYRAWRDAGSSLATGAVLAVYAAAWLRGWHGGGHRLPAAPFVSWATLILAVALALIAWRLQDRLARALLAVGAAWSATIAWRRFAPAEDQARGIAALGAGFVFLIAGLAVNWWLRLKETSGARA